MTTASNGNPVSPIEDVILQNGSRGMTYLLNCVDGDYCGKAAEKLINCPRGNVLITTGFYVKGFAETDGPLGAFFLAKALKILGFTPYIITDEYCRDFFDHAALEAQDIKTCYMPISSELCKEQCEKLYHELKPTCLISIERCGRAFDGKYYNMRKVDISDKTAPVDELFLMAKDILTIGIGDGGNEIGMGRAKDVIEAYLDIIPCVVTAEELIISTVSNWGGYALIAYLEILSGETLLPSAEEVDRYLKHIVSLGSVDGVKGIPEHSVDGFDFTYDVGILEDLKQAAAQQRSNTFFMSNDYADNSKSQNKIGKAVIDELTKWLGNLTGPVKLCDLGCGPGNLTHLIWQSIPNKDSVIKGYDIDPNAIQNARIHYPHIEFSVENLYTLSGKEQFDFIFSNEVLHWLPKLPSELMDPNNIIYYFSDLEFIKRYKAWAYQQQNVLFQNISKIMKPGAKAVLQFGFDGQLKGLYSIMNSIMFRYFKEYIKDIQFPLFYPQAEALQNIVKNAGLDIMKFQITREDLEENTVDEVVGFVKGFTQISLETIMGKAEAQHFYNLLLVYARERFSEASKKQWHHGLLVLSKGS